MPNNVVLRGGTVTDGTGSGVSRPADVWIRDGHIRALLQPGGPCDAEDEVDVSGLYVTPGFIDIHSHSDFSLPTTPSAAGLLMQGVTTVVGGNCGFSPFPVGDDARHAALVAATSFFGRGLNWQWTDYESYCARLDELRPAVNVALLVGHNSLRIAAMGVTNRAPDAGEMTVMKQTLRRALDGGAFGLSTGLIYAPGAYSAQDEIVELARCVAEYGALYATHMRDEAGGLVSSVTETLDVARTARVRTQISHHKAIGRRNWGSSATTLDLVDSALASGVSVGMDQYPYTASSTTLKALLPPWLLEGGDSQLSKRLVDNNVRNKARQEILHGADGAGPSREFEPAHVTVSSTSRAFSPDVVGNTIADVASRRQCDPVDAMFDLLAADPEIEVVIDAMGDEDVERIMGRTDVSVASDGWILDPENNGHPHPRHFGTFPRVFARYVREKRILSWETAVWKMTGLPATQAGVHARGTVTAGNWADLLVIDRDEIHDESTFERPNRLARGIRYAYVNGQCAVERGSITGQRSGQVLSRPRGGEQP